MTIAENQDIIVKDFLVHESWEDRYMRIMEYGDRADNYSPKEILESDCKFIEKMGFGQFLTVNRSNGVLLMAQRVISDATKYAKQLDSK
jgi:sulfur transfer protein SufE